MLAVARTETLRFVSESPIKNYIQRDVRYMQDRRTRYCGNKSGETTCETAKKRGQCASERVAITVVSTMARALMRCAPSMKSATTQ